MRERDGGGAGAMAGEGGSRSAARPPPSFYGQRGEEENIEHQTSEECKTRGSESE